MEQQKNIFIILIRIFLVLWAFFILLFLTDFLGIIKSIRVTNPAYALFFVTVNIIFIAILTAAYLFYRSSQDFLIKEKDIVFWQYQQITALSHLINKTGKALTTVLNRDKLMRLILESFIRIFHCPAGILLIYNENENLFHFEAAYGLNQTNMESLTFKSTHPVIADAVNNYKIISQQSLQSLEEKNIRILKTDKVEKIIRNVDTLTTITLRIGDKIFGVVFLLMPKNSSLIICEYDTLIHVAINQATIAIGSAIQSQFAIQDRLTMLYNHDYFVQRLKEELFRSTRYRFKVSLLMLDIDHFKSFNDTYGHLAGNYVLREVSKLFAGNIRITDIVARYGGEEFAILMTETGLSDAVKIAEKIRQVVHDFPYDYEGQKLHVTISVGICEQDGSQQQGQADYMGFIDLADKKLYEAKKTGRNRVCF
jgi:diguanylate cyclase (GGDEF)-like protein